MIVDTEGPGGKPYTVFEFGAILMYLADKTGKFMPKDTAKKYDVIQWLMVQVVRHRPGVRQLHAFQPVRAQARTTTRSAATRARCCGSTICSESGSARRNISAATNIRSPTWRPSPGRASTQAHGAKIDSMPNFKRWFEELSARPAIKAMIAKQADIKSSRETATDDNKDRFFNRGKYARA